MHPWYVSVDREELRRLYVDERHTTTEIAALLGCGPTTVRRRLDHFDIATRSRGTDPVRWLRRPVIAGKTRGIWSPALAYAVGLIATDGNLSGDGRHISIPSKDFDLLECLRQCLGLTNRIGQTRSGRGDLYYKLQWSDRVLYHWLEGIGLTAAKEPHLGRSGRPQRILRGLLPWLYRRRRLDHHVHRPLSCCEERPLRVRPALREDRVRQLPVRDVASNGRVPDHRREG